VQLDESVKKPQKCKLLDSTDTAAAILVAMINSIQYNETAIIYIYRAWILANFRQSFALKQAIFTHKTSASNTSISQIKIQIVRKCSIISNPSLTNELT